MVRDYLDMDTLYQMNGVRNLNIGASRELTSGIGEEMKDEIQKFIDSLYWRYLATNVDGCSPTAGNLLCCWIYMAAFALAYIIIGILALKQVDRDKR